MDGDTEKARTAAPVSESIFTRNLGGRAGRSRIHVLHLRMPMLAMKLVPRLPCDTHSSQLHQPSLRARHRTSSLLAYWRRTCLMIGFPRIDLFKIPIVEWP